MNKQLVILLLLSFAACTNPESYLHQAGPNLIPAGMVVEYLVKEEPVLKVQADTGNYYSPHLTDSVKIRITHGSTQYETPYFDPKYLNMEGELSVTENKYHDYFPESWYPLKNSKNFMTLRFFKDEDRLFFLTFNTLNGTMIGKYFEFE